MIAGLNRIFIFTICSKINHPPFIKFITLNLTIYFQSKTADSGRWIKGRDLMALSSYSNVGEINPGRTQNHPPAPAQMSRKY